MHSGWQTDTKVGKQTDRQKSCSQTGIQTSQTQTRPALNVRANLFAIQFFVLFVSLFVCLFVYLFACFRL